MSTYTAPKSSANRPFVVTAYRSVEGEDSPVAEVPHTCIVGVDDQIGCKVGIDHLRHRTKGPGFPLAVARCGIHEVAFTLYPPGWAPYRRQAVAPVDAEGDVVTDDAGEADWSNTVFHAAVDAEKGAAWERECAADDEPWWGTQWWQLIFAALLLGIHPDIDAGAQHRMARVLAIPTLELRDASALWSRRGYRAKGAAICGVVAELPKGERHPDHRLLRAGRVVGLWGRPMWWDHGYECLRPLAYPGADTAFNLGSSHSAIRPTSSVRGGAEGFG